MINQKLGIVIIIVYLIFYTPKFISDFLFYKSQGLVKLVYLTKDGNILTYKFDHGNFDGILMSRYIKENDKKNLVSVKKFNKEYAEKLSFKKYQMFSYKRHKKYSMFTSNISQLLLKLFKNINYDQIKVAIVVSVRAKKDNSYGNYIKLARYTVNKNHSIDDICRIHHETVKKAQKYSYIKNTTIYEALMMLNVNYIFNSWKGLSHIKLNNGNNLKRLNHHGMTKAQIKKFYTKKMRAHIKVDYLDNQYILSDIDQY